MFNVSKSDKVSITAADNMQEIMYSHLHTPYHNPSPVMDRLSVTSTFVHLSDTNVVSDRVNANQTALK